LQVEAAIGRTEAALVEELDDQMPWLQFKQRYEAAIANGAAFASIPGNAAAASEAIPAPPAAAVSTAIMAVHAIAHPISAVAGAVEVSKL
jgi:hypothetical protein